MEERTRERATATGWTLYGVDPPDEDDRRPTETDERNWAEITNYFRDRPPPPKG